MKQQAEDDFLLDLASEEADAARFDDLSRPADSVWPDWSGYVREAWHYLRDDRYYGAMGGVGGIYYSSLSQYARDHEIPIWPFARYVMTLDNEFVAISNEKAQASNKEDD